MFLGRSVRLLVAFLFSVAAATAAHALPSWSTFAYSSGSNCGGTCDTQLQLGTSGGPVTLTATNRGWVQPSGSNNGSSASNNYIAGLCGSSDTCSGGDLVQRNWFAFQMPVGISAVTSATLLLEVPAPTSPRQGVYTATGPLTYTVYDVSSAATTFTTGLAGAAEYADLGSGTVYGTRDYTTADQGTTPGITLNGAAVAWLNNQIGQLIVIGGAATPQFVAIPTLSPWALLLLAGMLGLATWVLRRRGHLPG